MKIYLIRHGESYGNIQGKIISTTDFGLTEKGILQAKRIGQKINAELDDKNIITYCSCLARTKQTLLEILKCLDQKDIKTLETDDLKEMDLGLLEGMSWEERHLAYPEIDLDIKLSSLQAPCGESYQDVKKRCLHFIQEHLNDPDNDQNIIIVSHGITLRILTNLLLNRPDQDVNTLNWMENTALTKLIWDKENNTYQVLSLNDYAHLKELQTIGYEHWGLFSKKDYLNKP